MKVCPNCQVLYPSTFAVCAQDGSVLESFQGWQPGEVIQGKFRIVKRIGTGRIGVVFKAEQLVPKEPRALKLLVGPIAREELLVQLLRREVRAARVLNHSNAVRIEDVQQTEKGLTFLVFEHVDGENLADILQRTGPLSPVRVIGIVRQICSALELAHSFGVIHGDIRPHNVLLVRQPDDKFLVKVMEFGLAKVKQAAAERGIEVGGVSNTGGGFVVGIPPYIAPEQAKRVSGQGYDRRSDLYSLGVLMYEALSGELPWPPQTPADAPPLPLQGRRPELKLPDLVAGIVTKAMDKNPALRFQSASEMALSLSMAEELLGRDAEITKVDSDPSAGNETGESSSPLAVAPARPGREPEVLGRSTRSQSHGSPLASDGHAGTQNSGSVTSAEDQSTEILEGAPVTAGTPDKSGKFPASSSQIEAMFETPSLLLSDVRIEGEVGAAVTQNSKETNLTGDQAGKPGVQTNPTRAEPPPKVGTNAPPTAVQNVIIRPIQPSKAEPVRSAAVTPSSKGRSNPAPKSAPVRDPAVVQTAPRPGEQAEIGQPAPKLFGLSSAWGGVAQSGEGGPLRIVLIALTFILLIVLAVRLVPRLAPWVVSPPTSNTNNEIGVQPSSPPKPTPPVAAATPAPETTTTPPSPETSPPGMPRETTAVSPPAPSAMQPDAPSDIGTTAVVPPSNPSEPAPKEIGTTPSSPNVSIQPERARPRTSSRSLGPVRRLSPAQEAKVRDKLVIAGFLMDRKDFRGAIEAFGAALNIDPTNREAQSGLRRARQASNAQKKSGIP